MKEPSSLARPRIVSIQSQVVFGCAGNTAAVPLLQCLGACVHAVPTVLLSNTPNYPTVTGTAIAAAQVADLLNGLLERVLAIEIDAVLVGYIRDADTVAVVASFIDRVRGGNPSVTILCDPVMGDTDLDFFIPDITARAVRDELVSRATIITPNLFEAHFISGRGGDDLPGIGSALQAAGPEIVIVSGIGLGVPHRQVETLAFHGKKSWGAFTPVLGIRPTGTGDLLAAAFLFQFLMSGEIGPSLQQAVRVVFMLMQQALAANRQELEPNCAGIHEAASWHRANDPVRLTRQS